MTHIDWIDVSNEHPTDVYDKNPAISNTHFVLTDGKDMYGNPIVGFTWYSHCANRWNKICIRNTSYNVIAWSKEFNTI